MCKEGEALIQAGQAALIVTYGNTTRKHQPLDRDLVVLGRTPTCDIALVSPEVAAVHCILQRGSDGWRLRDCCGGRHATRLNGRPVHEETLHDSDVLQIGTFSFEVRLPSTRATPAPGCTPVVGEHLQRLQRSRRNLLRLALRLRRRAHKSNALPPTLAELERQAECLRGLQRESQALVAEYQGRLGELEKAEREVCDERAAFESECVERQARLDKAEHDMACHQAELEARLQLRWQECQERCRQAEQAHRLFLHAMPGQAASTEELAMLLDRRRQELDYFARHLRRQRQSLEQTPPSGHAVAGAGSVRDRLAHLPSLKRDLAGSSPSAPGDQLRSDSARLTADPAQRSANRTAAATP